MTEVYKIIKERWYFWPAWGNEGPKWVRDKHETVLTERKARVTQCVRAANRENEPFFNPARRSSYLYRCFVQIQTSDGWEDYGEQVNPELPDPGKSPPQGMIQDWEPF